MANIVIKVLDPSNATVTSSTAAITISLDHNSISSGTTTVNAVAGVATFTNIKVNLTGAYSMTAASTGLTSVNATSTSPPDRWPGSSSPASRARPPSTSGAFSVTAQDAGGNTITGYNGTVHFTSSDRAAILPANYTFVAGDSGVHKFSATLKTVGTQSITATDTVNSAVTGSQTGIVVQVGAPATLTPTGTPQSAHREYGLLRHERHAHRRRRKSRQRADHYVHRARQLAPAACSAPVSRPPPSRTRVASLSSRIHCQYRRRHVQSARESRRRLHEFRPHERGGQPSPA